MKSRNPASSALGSEIYRHGDSNPGSNRPKPSTPGSRMGKNGAAPLTRPAPDTEKDGLSMPADRIYGGPSWTGPRTYFVKSAPRPSLQGPIKIGHTAHLAQRVRNMQAGNPHELVLLADMPGLRHHERLLHERFAAGRLKPDCEWFRHDTPGLLEFIEAVRVYVDHYHDAAPDQIALVDEFLREAQQMPIRDSERAALLKMRGIAERHGLEALAPRRIAA